MNEVMVALETGSGSNPAHAPAASASASVASKAPNGAGRARSSHPAARGCVVKVEVMKVVMMMVGGVMMVGVAGCYQGGQRT